MNFSEAVSTCLKKYADFDGTAARSEYWWFWLFLVGAAAVLSVAIGDLVAGIFNLAMLVPQLSAGARRLHDTDRSGWWQLLMFVPIIGWIVLIVFLAQEGKENRFGAPVVVA